MVHTIDLHDVRATVDLFDRAARTLRESKYRSNSIERLPASGKVLVTGDLHDNANHLAKILEIVRLRRSRRHHVVLQELIHGENLINGLDFSYRMLATVAELVIRFPGQVHPILANHELAQMTGRAVDKGASDRVALFNEALRFDYGDEWEQIRDSINEFFAAMPIALYSEAGLLCTHSLPSDDRLRRFDFNIINRKVSQMDLYGPGGSVYELVWGRQYSEHSVRMLADRWNVKLFCVGHNHVAGGIELHCRNVLVLNTDHDGAAVLPIDLGRLPLPQAAMSNAIRLSTVAAIPA